MRNARATHSPSGWTSFERRWLSDLLDAAIPAGGSGRPGLGDLSLASFWSHYDATAPPLLRIGLRVTVWLLTFLPIVYAGRARSFGALDADARDRLLERAARSDVFLVRQMLETLKAIACFAYFHDDGVRASLRTPRSRGGAPGVAASDEVAP